MSDNPALLPSGLADLLPPEAEIEAQAVNSLMALFTRHHYRRIKPPLMEFEDSLLSHGPGAAMAKQTFRLMDPATGRMMGVRPDTTQQIARIAATILADAPRPLRLAYATDVLRTKGSHLRPERQFTQVGCELIGGETRDPDVEAALMGIEGLAALGLRGLCLDLSFPPLATSILTHYAPDMDATTQALFTEGIRKRDPRAVQEAGARAGHEGGACLAQIMACTGDAQAALEELRTVPLPERAAAHVAILTQACQTITRSVRSSGLDVQITLDPLESAGFEYKSGIAFTYFAKGVRGELGRGGQYDIVFAKDTPHEHIETACGFSLYMDTIRKALPRTPEAGNASSAPCPV